MGKWSMPFALGLEPQLTCDPASCLPCSLGPQVPSDLPFQSLPTSYLQPLPPSDMSNGRVHWQGEVHMLLSHQGLDLVVGRVGVRHLVWTLRTEHGSGLLCQDRQPHGAFSRWQQWSVTQTGSKDQACPGTEVAVLWGSFICGGLGWWAPGKERLKPHPWPRACSFICAGHSKLDGQLWLWDSLPSLLFLGVVSRSSSLSSQISHSDHPALLLLSEVSQTYYAVFFIPFSIICNNVFALLLVFCPPEMLSSTKAGCLSVFSVISTSLRTILMMMCMDEGICSICSINIC